MADEWQDIARGLIETRERAQLAVDLTSNWDLFSDADPLPCEREEFLSRLLDGDFVELVDVDDDALEDPFAYERGPVFPIRRQAPEWLLVLDWSAESGQGEPEMVWQFQPRSSRRSRPSLRIRSVGWPRMSDQPSS